MFSYKLPFLKKEITIKELSVFFTVLYVIGIVPMLIMGFFDYPSADDFSMMLQPHQKFVQTGNIFVVIWAAVEKAVYLTLNYEGYFFSSFLTAMGPNAYGAKFYFLVPFIILGMLTFGICYFFNALFVKVFKADKYFSNTASMITLIMMTQFISASEVRAEAFYWYCGAVNYTFTFGMAFFWLGLLIGCVYEDNDKKKKQRFVWACIWGFCLGGANYMTALELAICSFLLIVIRVLHKKNIVTLHDADDKMIGSFKLLIVPAVFNLVGFMCSCFAPGNKNREAEISEHYGAVKSVLLSLYSTFDVIIDKMMRWETIVFLLILVPIFWKMGQNIKYRFRHPFVFTVFAYGMISANLTAPLYGVGNFESGRMSGLAWMDFVAFAVLTIFYVTLWARQYLEENKGLKTDDTCERFSNSSSSLILTMLVILAFGSALCVIPSPHYYSATSCLYELATGNAARYAAENKERFRVLNDPSVDVAVLREFTDAPDILFFADIDDPGNGNYWINLKMAEYYNKKEIILERK